MTDTAGHDLAKTHFCRFPGCTNEARSDRGLYSKCDEHRKENVGNRSSHSNGGGNGSLAQRITALSQMARAADKAKAHAKKKTEDALAAKRKADEMERDLRMEMRALGMNEDNGVTDERRNT